MKTEEELFSRLLRKKYAECLKEYWEKRGKTDVDDSDIGDVPAYDVDAFEKYLSQATGRNPDCDRKYILYLRSFVIPKGAVNGDYLKQGRNGWKSRLATQLSKFIISKNPPPEAPTVVTEVSLTMHHHRVMNFV